MLLPLSPFDDRPTADNFRFRKRLSFFLDRISSKRSFIQVSSFWLCSENSRLDTTDRSGRLDCKFMLDKRDADNSIYRQLCDCDRRARVFQARHARILLAAQFAYRYCKFTIDPWKNQRFDLSFNEIPTSASFARERFSNTGDIIIHTRRSESLNGSRVKFACRSCNLLTTIVDRSFSPQWQKSRISGIGEF